MLSALAINEHGAGAPIPFSGRGALRSAVGRGAGAGYAEMVAGRRSCWQDTVLLVDVSGSHGRAAVSPFRDVAHRCGLRLGCVAARRSEKRYRVYSFSDELVEVPARRGFALRDAINVSQPHGGTHARKGGRRLNRSEKYDRLIVITDEQAHDSVPVPKGKGYVINVASYKNGVGYGKWTHIDGWSESVIEYIRTLEQEEPAN